jgi:hypothetical protein
MSALAATRGAMPSSPASAAMISASDTAYPSKTLPLAGEQRRALADHPRHGGELLARLGVGLAHELALAEQEAPECREHGLAGLPIADRCEQLRFERPEPPVDEVLFRREVVETVCSETSARHANSATVTRSKPRSVNKRRAVSATCWRVCSFLRSRNLSWGPTSARSETSRGSLRPTSSPPRSRRRCGASSGTGTAASCSADRVRRRVGAVRRRATPLVAMRGVQGVAAGGLMTLAMAAVRRPRGAARARPLPGLHRRDVRGRDDRGAARRHDRRARELALGLPRQPHWAWSRLARLRRGCRHRPPSGPSMVWTPRRVLLAAATAAFMLTCIWAAIAMPGMSRRSSGSPRRPPRSRSRCSC